MYLRSFYNNFSLISLMMGAFLLSIAVSALGQEPQRYRVMFYNVENLFDTQDDPAIDDNEFLPDGDKHWNDKKYYDKLNNIYKVIISCGEWEPPAIVGLCEVENRKVVNDLVFQTPLKKFNYQALHFDSPDRRGIDVALLFRANHFSPDTAFPVSIVFPFQPESTTRDILYVKGRLADQETIHIYVNHWPSRYGGYQATIPKRNHVATVLRAEIDSIIATDSQANILVMGDFNDGPYEPSMLEYLNASVDSSGPQSGSLVNLTAVFEAAPSVGTLKYKENWDVFDQLVVTNNMLGTESTLYISNKGAQIHRPDFLIEKDERYLGEKPFRTYSGMRYLGGYSDHLPVYVDLKVR